MNKQNLRYSKNPDPEEILKILKTANPEPAMRKAWQAKYDAINNQPTKWADCLTLLQ